MYIYGPERLNPKNLTIYSGTCERIACEIIIKNILWYVNKWSVLCLESNASFKSDIFLGKKNRELQANYTKYVALCIFYMFCVQ